MTYERQYEWIPPVGRQKKKSRWVRWANSARTIAGEKLSSEREKKLTRKKRDPNLLVSVFCYDIVYISNVSKTWKGKQGETVRGARGERAKRSGRWEGCKDESAEIGGGLKKTKVQSLNLHLTSAGLHLSFYQLQTVFCTCSCGRETENWPTQWRDRTRKIYVDGWWPESGSIGL